jgi:hypothetical protein
MTIQKLIFLADKASIFDLRTYDIVSTFSFDDRTKPACSIKDGKIIFNVACKKALRAEKAEMLFHPLKAIFGSSPICERSFLRTYK